MRITAAVSRPGAPAPVLEQVELAGPRDDEIRVRMVAVGICYTDLHAHAGMLAPLPIVLGHEGAGVVEAVGSRVSGLAPGDHVILSGSSCGHCPNCDAARPSYCDTAMPRSFGGARMDRSTALSAGGEALHSHFFGQSSFATHAICPARTAVMVPADLPLEKLAALGCGVITGAGAVIEALRPGYGDSIAIFGVGGVGLSAVMAARLMGVSRIIAVDVNAERLALARDLGATDTLESSADVAQQIRALTGRGVTHSFNSTTVPAIHTAALECLAMRGVAGFVSAPRGEWTPAMFPMLGGGRTLRGILGGDAEPATFLPRLIEYWRQGRFPFDRLLQYYRFSQIAEAFADTAAGRAIKPVLLFEGD